MPATDVRVTRLLIPLASFVGPFVGTAIVVALPTIAGEHGLSTAQAGWFTAAYFLAAAVLMLPVSRAGDLYGRSHLLAGGLALICLAGLGCTVVTDPVGLIALRLLQGTGAAGVFGSAAPALAELVPPAQRGRAVGLNITITYLGLAAGPGLGGVLTQYLGWRSIFYIGAAWGLPVAAVLWWRLPRGGPRGVAPAPFDLAGATLIGLALGLLMYGSGRPLHADGMLALAGGAALVWAFLAWQRRAPAPLLDLRLVAPGQALRYCTAAALAHYTGTFALAYLLSLALQNGGRMSAAATGALLAIQPVVQTLLAAPAGRLSDRTDPRVVMNAGLLAAALGVALLAVQALGISPAWLVVSLVLIGAGTALFVPPNATLAMSSVGPGHFGTAIGLLQTTRLVGQVGSMTLAVLLVTATGAAQSGRYASVLVIAAGVCSALVLAAAALSTRGGAMAPARDAG